MYVDKNIYNYKIQYYLFIYFRKSCKLIIDIENLIPAGTLFLLIHQIFIFITKFGLITTVRNGKNQCF